MLDSVVPPNGPEPLNLPTFAAIPRVLRQLCARGVRAHHARTGRRPDEARATHGARALSGRGIDGDGHAHTVRFSANTLLDVLIAGDLEPVLRAEFPAAVRSAADGDTAPLARLLRDAAQRGEGEGEEESPSESFDMPLYFATTCEEELFPWSRAASPGKRLAEASAQIRGAGRRADRAVRAGQRARVQRHARVRVLALHRRPRPRRQAPFPSVPTLILSGADDLRTPTANAREVAAQIPGSQLLVVPEVGHSVLSSEPSGCARKALQALFSPRRSSRARGGPADPGPAQADAAGAGRACPRCRPPGATAGCPDARFRRSR